MKTRFLQTLKLILTLTILQGIFGVQPIYAQFPSIRNFSAQDYGGGTQNWQVMQSLQGYTFVANNLGVMVFNGASWDVRPVPNNTNVHAIASDAKGDRFYVGAIEEFGYFVNTPPLRTAEYVSIAQKLPASERRFKDIWKICVLPDRRVIFQSAQHLFIYNPASDRVATIALQNKITDMSLAGNHLYVSTEIEIFHLSGDRLIPLAGSREIAARKVVGVFLEKDGDPVFTTRKSGFFRYQHDGFRTYHIPRLSEALTHVNIYSVAANDRQIAIGTIGEGLYVWDRLKGSLHHLDRRNGLRNNTVLGIMIDSDNNIWTALDNGLSYIIFDSPFMNIFTDANGIGTGYASQPFHDRLYLGTNEGLYHIPLPGDFSNHTFNPVKVAGVTGQIWTLTKIGDTLFCGADAGAFIISGNSATPISGMSSTWGFRPYPGRDDIIIASLYDGFAVIKRDGSEWKLSHKIEGINESTINFEIDSHGILWYSHWLQGVYRLTLSSDLKQTTGMEYFNASNQLPSDDNNLISKIDGLVYISAADGYYVYSPAKSSGFKGGRLLRQHWLEKLFPTEGITTRLFQTTDGNLWAYRPQYLAFAQRNKNIANLAAKGAYSVNRFYYAATVGKLQMNLGNISYLPGGLTVMSQDEGFFIVDPNVTTPPGRNVWINFVHSKPGEGEESIESFPFRDDNNSKTFEVRHSESSLTFEFAIPQYREAAAVEFATWIEGYEKGFTPYSPLTYRDIAHIPPGKYTFHVKARDMITGKTSESTIEFRVRPEWYETWWARTIAVILIGVAIYFIIEGLKKWIMSRIERRRIEEEKERIKKEEHERAIQERAAAIENNERLNREIKQKSKELAGSDLYNQKRGDTLRETEDALTRILRESSSTDSTESVLKRIREVRQDIRSRSAEEQSLERIDENFNLIFDDLLTKLAEQYPALTRNDIRLCSYLKLNMSSKEIASLMHLSERSVESNRYRLRKKLGMESGKSFSDFFKGIS